jgi:hypothetical protein
VVKNLEGSPNPSSLAASITSSTIVKSERHQAHDSTDQEQGDEAADVSVNSPTQDHREESKRDKHQQATTTAFDESLSLCRRLIHFASVRAE